MVLVVLGAVALVGGRCGATLRGEAGGGGMHAARTSGKKEVGSSGHAARAHRAHQSSTACPSLLPYPTAQAATGSCSQRTPYLRCISDPTSTPCPTHYP